MRLAQKPRNLRGLEYQWLRNLVIYVVLGAISFETPRGDPPLGAGKIGFPAENLAFYDEFLQVAGKGPREEG